MRVDFMGIQPVQLHWVPMPGQATPLVSCSLVAILKFSVTFEQEIQDFHFAPGTEN